MPLFSGLRIKQYGTPTGNVDPITQAMSPAIHAGGVLPLAIGALLFGDHRPHLAGCTVGDSCFGAVGEHAGRGCLPTPAIGFMQGKLMFPLESFRDNGPDHHRGVCLFSLIGCGAASPAGLAETSGAVGRGGRISFSKWHFRCASPARDCGSRAFGTIPVLCRALRRRGPTGCLGWMQDRRRRDVGGASGGVLPE